MTGAEPKALPSSLTDTLAKSLRNPDQTSFAETIFLGLRFGDFAERKKTVDKGEDGADLIEDHRVHDAEAGEEGARDANRHWARLSDPSSGRRCAEDRARYPAGEGVLPGSPP